MESEAELKAELVKLREEIPSLLDKKIDSLEVKVWRERVLEIKKY